MTWRVGDALAAAAHRLGDDAAQVLARIGGSLGAEARAAHRKIAAPVDDGSSRRHRAEIAAAARAPIPFGVRGVHPTWIEAVIAEMPPRARSAVAAPAGDPTDVWLARSATAAFPPMPDAARPLTSPTSPTFGERVVARAHGEIVDWLSAIGADQMAFALGPAATTHPLLAAAAARIAQPPRVGKLGSQRAAIGRCRGVSIDDPRCFVVVGARALAPHLADDAVARLQLTYRLPRDLGVLVARELHAHADASLDQAPELPAL